MEEDKNISKVETKGPIEEDGETTTGCLFKHPTNVSGEISDNDDAGYDVLYRELKLKLNQAIQDSYAKQKTCVGAGKMYMEVIESRNIGDLDAKQKIYMEALKERKDAQFKILEAQRELMWQQDLLELSNYNKIISDCNEIIPLMPWCTKYAAAKERTRAQLLGMISEWEEELELLRVEAKENQAIQQRLVVEIAFAVSNANLTNGDISKIASATSNVHLTNDIIAPKEKLFREKRAELEAST